MPERGIKYRCQYCNAYPCKRDRKGRCKNCGAAELEVQIADLPDDAMEVPKRSALSLFEEFVEATGPVMLMDRKDATREYVRAMRERQDSFVYTGIQDPFGEPAYRGRPLSEMSIDAIQRATHSLRKGIIYPDAD